MKKILITGSSGYIGSSLYLYLKNIFKVKGLDKKNCKYFTTTKVNLLHKKRLDNILRSFKPDLVIHLAAQSLVDETINKKKYYLNNIIATKNLLYCLKKNHISNLVFSSTAAVYKYKNQNKWQIDRGHDFNIDPNLNLDWISLLVTASKNTNNDLDYSINLSDGYALYINSNSIHIFPNPISLINNNLKIKVISAYEQNLKIEIYNLLGQNLKSFNDNIPGNGEKVILWNGKNKLNKNISNGVYIIKLNAGNSTIIKKLTVLNSSN